MAEPLTTRRLVALGKKIPAHATRHIRYANQEPLWLPQSVRPVEPDSDDVRKYALEAFGAESLVALGRARSEGFS